MKLLKVLIAFVTLVTLQIAAAQWLHVPPPVEARTLMVVQGGVAAASADYTATVAKIYLRGDEGTHAPFRIVVYDSSYNVLATSNEGTSSEAAGTVSVTFSSNPTLSASGTYFLGVMSTTNYLLTYGITGGDIWDTLYVSVSYPTAPSINPATDSSGMKIVFCIWLENTLGQKIVGDNNTAGYTQTTSSTALQNDRLYYKYNGYTRETL